MNITMDLTRIGTVEEIEHLLKTNADISFPEEMSKKERYDLLNKILLNLKYKKLKKSEKTIVKKLLTKLTGYSERQIKRIIKKYKEGKLVWQPWQKEVSKHIYTRKDIVLLHETDMAHLCPSGTTISAILKREFSVFKRSDFECISGISVSHIYRLRQSKTYQCLGITFTKTKNTPAQYGERRKPHPNGMPGFFRVDTVHQGDKGQKKGVYYVNITDEVTQWEYVFCVPAISEKYMKQVLGWLSWQCPFQILNFHSDNGSEFINKVVSELLSKLHIKQTKSRPRRHNDNGLIESKNGSVVRKFFGHVHIPATEKNAQLLNNFCIEWLNVYLNFHRPCAFPSSILDNRGKEKILYKQADYQTPYEKLKSLPNAKQFLNPVSSFADLDKTAYKYSDTLFAQNLIQARQNIFQNLLF